MGDDVVIEVNGSRHRLQTMDGYPTPFELLGNGLNCKTHGWQSYTLAYSPGDGTHLRICPQCYGDYLKMCFPEATT